MKQIVVDDIKTLLLDVSEPILKDNLQDFIKFQFQQQSILITSESSIFYYYLKETKKYFIAKIDNLNKTSYIKPQILKAYYFNNSNLDISIDLFIQDRYFAIYENKELIFFQATTDDVLQEQIINFVKMSLKLNISKVVKLSLDEEKELEDIFLENIKEFKQLNILKNKRNKELKKFMVFCFFCFIIIFFALVYKYSIQDKLQIQELQTIEHTIKDLISTQIVYLVQKIENSSLELININLTSSNLLNFTIRSVDKNNLINFLEENKDMKVRTLQFNNEANSYELNTTTELY